MENEELKPCPFCGDQKPAPATTKLVVDGYTYHLVMCIKCGVKTSLCETYDEALDIWNTRSNEELTIINEDPSETTDIVSFIEEEFKILLKRGIRKLLE